MSHVTRSIETPIGRYGLAASRDGLQHVWLAEAACPPPLEEIGERANAEATRHVEAAERALADYFAGRRRDFTDLRLAPSGSPFQRLVWRALQAIPCGRTATYGEIARSIGRRGAARAVGRANHDNPLSIIVPCHRVIGADGALTGYAGGLARKRWLLEHEGALARRAGRRAGIGPGSGLRA